jgi:hypothetical protein
VPDGVAQKFAQDQRRIAYRSGDQAGFAQVSGQLPAGGRDT